MVKLYINGNEMDMFSDETILITSKLKDVRDISRVFSDFTQQFSIPASGRNNVILQKFYDNSIYAANAVDYTKKQPCEIEIDGVLYKKGLIKYDQAVFVKGKISHHVMTYTGPIAGLSDVIGDITLSELDLSAYDHDTNAANTYAGINNASQLFNDDIIYPLITANEVQWTPDTLANGRLHRVPNPSNLDEFIYVEGLLDPEEFRPAIRPQPILDAINTRFVADGLNIQFDSSFDADNLYMWLGNKPDEDTPTAKTLTYESPITIYKGTVAFIDAGTGIIDCDALGPYDLAKWNISLQTGASVHWRMELIRIDELTGTEYNTGVFLDHTGGIVTQVVATYNEMQNGTAYWRMESDAGETINMTMDLVARYNGIDYLMNGVTVNNFIFENKFQRMSEKMPDLTVMEWIEGLVKMHNFIPVVDDRNFGNITLVPYNTWLNRNQKIHNLTKEVNEETFNILIPSIPKKIQFLYEDPEEALNAEFKIYNGRGYGDLINTAVGGSGQEFVVKLPFTNMLWDNPDPVTVEEYLIGRALQHGSGSYSDDFKLWADFTPIEDIAYWMYRIPSGANATIELDGWAQPVTTYKLCNTFSDKSDVPNSQSLNWGLEVDSFDRVDRQDVITLYDEYEQLMNSYINRTVRVYNYIAVISPSVLSQIKMNDLIELYDRTYLINSIEVDTLTRKAKLELLQYFRDPQTQVPPIGDNVDPDACLVWVDGNEKPTAPINLASSLITETTFTLSWDASVTLLDYIEEYRVFKNGIYYGSTVQPDVNSNAPTTIDIVDIMAGSNNVWTVLGKDNGNNFSDQSAGLSVQMVVPPALAFTNPIVIDSFTDTTIDISWSPAVPSGYPVDSYTVYLDGVSINTLPSTTLTYQFAGLTANTSYDIHIVVTDTNTDTDTSTTVTQVTEQALPSAPLSLSATDITDTTFQLHWIPSNAFSGNGNAIVEYEIWKNGVHSYSVTGTPPSDNIGIAGMIPEETNFWQVLGIDDQGLRSPLSVGINVTQLAVPSNAPDDVSGLTAVQDFNQYIVDLEWDPVIADSYVVYRSEDNLNFAIMIETAHPFWSDYTVQNLDTYWYKVKARFDGILSDNYSNVEMVTVTVI